MNGERRAANPPLTESERTLLARGEYRLSMILLVEAVKLAKRGGTPNACAHSAYYAMHHCAAAALYAVGGVGKQRDVPKSHTHLIAHFGKLVAAEPEDGALAGAGSTLDRAFTIRERADYGLVEGGVSAEAAQRLAADAEIFVAACAKRWRLELPADTMEHLALQRRLDAITPPD